MVDRVNHVTRKYARFFPAPDGTIIGKNTYGNPSSCMWMMIFFFSPTLEDHLIHLDEMMKMLDDSGETLSLSKSRFVYPSIKALGHHVSRLEL